MFEISRKIFLHYAGAAIATAVLPGLALASESTDEKQPKVYFQQTGHHLGGEFLQFWRRNRNGYLFGLPITEGFTDWTGKTVQYFENVMFEGHPESPQKVRLGNLGDQLVDDNYNFPGISLFIKEEFYKKYGGYELFGRPISAPIAVGEDSLIQYTQRFAFLYHYQPLVVPPPFDNAYKHYLEIGGKFPRLIWPGEIEPVPLGRKATELKNIPTEPVERYPQAAIYTPHLYDNQKRIEVSLQKQLLVAYEGDQSIMQTQVTTGKENFDTPPGRFRILAQRPVMTYDSPFRDEWDYLVPDVPFNQLFHPAGYFLHGLYWHDRLGEVRSAGCVNLNNDDAKFLYDWARIGTAVVIS